jgi:hypothetical protein
MKKIELNELALGFNQYLSVSNPPGITSEMVESKAPNNDNSIG